MVAIARAIDISARVLILDEPTSSLDSDEVRAAVRDAAAPARRGHGDPVRHALPRPGLRDLGPHHRAAQRQLVGEYPAAELDHAALVAAMVGRDRCPTRDAGGARAHPAAAAARPPRAARARPRAARQRLEREPRDQARARSWASPGCSARAAPNSRACCSASTRRRGRDPRERRSRSRSPIRRTRSRIGLAFCPEERKTEGIVDDLSIRENIVLALQARTGLWRKLPAARSAASSPTAWRACSTSAPPDLDVPIGDALGRQPAEMPDRALARHATRAC